MRRMTPLALATVVSVVGGVVLAVSIAGQRHAGTDTEPPTDDANDANDANDADSGTSSSDRPRDKKKRRRDA